MFLHKLLYVCVYSTPSNEHSTSDAGGINDYLMRSAYAKAGATATSAALRQQFLNSDFAATPKAVARAAPRGEPETIVLDESEEGEDAGKMCEEGLPKPIQVGNCLFKCQLPTINAQYSFPDDAAGKRMLKRHLANSDLDYYPDVYTDADYAASTKLRTSNV